MVMLYIIFIGIVIAAFIILRNYGKFIIPFEAATTATTLQEKLPYQKKDYLLSVAERNFYETLKIVADNHNSIVFAKVRLEDLIWLPRNTQNLLKWRGYVRSRHIDFVLCERPEIKPICAIELDDASHNTVEAKTTDDMKDKILASAGLPLLRIRVQATYDPIDLTQKIKEKIV